MKISGNLFVGFFSAAVLGFFSALGQPQASTKDCDIKVEAKTKNPAPGQSNGKIELIFSDSQRKFKIYLINKGEERSKKDSGKIIENLSKGFYDFVILDSNGCAKQITVTLN